MRHEFDSLIGRLDRILSELMVHRDNLHVLDLADRQTLKHHAEDMAGAAASILRALEGKAEREPAEKREPKVRDRVRVVVDGGPDAGRAGEGFVGWIDQIDTEDPRYRLTFNDGVFAGWAAEVEVIS